MAKFTTFLKKQSCKESKVKPLKMYVYMTSLFYNPIIAIRPILTPKTRYCPPKE